MVDSVNRRYLVDIRVGLESGVALKTIGFSLGIALGPLLAGFPGTIFFQLPFWVDGALCLLGSLAVLFFMSETVGRGGEIS